jgi:hypothetical protein
VFWFRVFKIKCSIVVIAINQALSGAAYSTAGARQIRKGH